MTRTNRHMSEPPNLDPLAETESAARRWRHTHEIEPSWKPTWNRSDGSDEVGAPPAATPDYGRAVGWFISLLMFTAVAIPCYYAVQHVRATRAAPAPAIATPAPAPNTTAANTLQCDPPAKPGDKLVIVVTRSGEQLAARCVPITNPHAPERSLKP